MQKSEQASGDKPKARGRPRTFDRDAALAKAVRLFWLKGYEGTSIAELTEAMGIAAPSLYAAFGSKDALYAEALRYYATNYEDVVWGGFRAASTAREAVERYLLDSAAGLTGCRGDNPLGCMVTLSFVDPERQAGLAEATREARTTTLQRLETRIAEAQTAGEISARADPHALARFLQTVQSGMSILARDGVGRQELEAVVTVALLGWDAQVGSAG